MSKLFITDKTEHQKLLEYLPVGGVFDTAKAFPEDSSIGLYTLALSKVTQEAMSVLAAVSESVLPFNNMDVAFSEEWANALDIGSTRLPIRYATNPSSLEVKKQWVTYTMYGFEEIYTIQDINDCLSKLDLPITAYMWDAAPPEFKTDLYKVSKKTEDLDLEPLATYIPASGRSNYVILFKVNADVFRVGGFPYTFPLPFTDSYIRGPLLQFLLNLVPYYMTVLVKI